MISRETDFTKQEDSTSDTAQINFNAGASSTTSWSRLRDPRIIRVSRAFGGKDRHSKVCTVRGPRDRRVRLSVHTAIQLYDLQDRLGLNQPSKVVDWLLNAAKHEIDELPPLQFPQGSYCASLLPLLNNSNQLRQSDQKQGLTGRLKDVSAETPERDEDWARSREEEMHFNLEINQENAFVSTENFSSSRQQHPSSLSSLMNTSSFPFNSFVRWDPSNLSLSQSQSHLTRSPSSLLHQPHSHEDWHNFSLVPMQSALSTPSVGSHHHQVLVYQPVGMSAQPYFHSQISAASYAEFNFQSSQLSTSSNSSPTVESSTLPARPFHFNMTANLLPSQNNDGS